MNAFDAKREHYVPIDLPLQTEDRMAWFRHAKFGMFLHWGVYALLGRGEWVMFNERISVKEYAKLAEQFNPADFDAYKWARVAKAAGMKYMVLTTRHHDGFCLFDSKASDFTSVKTAAKRDFVAEFVEACRQEGLKVGFYYSPLDWRFPGYFFPELYYENALEMKEQCWAQIRELMTNYGKIDILWYDGEWLAHGGIGWEGQWLRRADWPRGPYKRTNFFWESDRLNAMVRELQPEIMVNNRSGWEGDFQVRERRIGDLRTDKPWEACATLAATWGWVPGKPLLSLRECIKNLVSTVVRDGNYLLNIGPTPTGLIEERQIARLEQVGQWLQGVGEAIYGTRGGPFQPGDWGGATYKDNKIYIHIYEWTEDNVVLPNFPQELVSVTGFNCQGVQFKQDTSTMSIHIPLENRDPFDSIVTLEYSGPINWEGHANPEADIYGLADV